MKVVEVKMSSIVEVSNLTKTFGSFKALENVNLTVNKGQIHGFIGPNGAGKSTTIRVLLGMLKADSGEVSIFGKNAWSDAVDIHKRVSYVPGNANLWPNLTGGEVIDLLLKMRGQEVDEQRKNKLIERYKLNPSKKCRTYSTGNRQKVVLIAALAADADLYILDEPTAGLDPLMERLFQESIFEVKREGKSVLLSSHILSEVESLCDSVSIIREGKIIESGSLEELRHLTRNKLMVETEKPVSDIHELSGIHDLEQNEDNHYEFQVDQSKIDSVISHLSKHGIVKLESYPPTLEDLFIQHYEKSEGGR